MSRRKNSAKARSGQTARPDVPYADRLETAARWVFYAGLALGASLFAPEIFYDGFETPKLFAAECAALLALGLWGASLLLREDPALRLPRATLPLAALFAVAAFSILWSGNSRLAAERLLHVGSLASYGLLAWGLFRGRSIRGPLYFVVFAAGTLALWALILDWVTPLRMALYPNFLARYSETHVVDLYRELISNQGNPNYLMHILTIAAPLTLGALIAEISSLRERRARALTLAASLSFFFLVELVCFFRSQNRSSLLGFLLALALLTAIMLFFHRKRILDLLASRWKVLVLSVAGLLLILATFARFSSTGGELLAGLREGVKSRAAHWQTRFASLSDLRNIDVYSRVVFLESGAAMIADSPVLGKGIGQFLIQYPKYKTAEHWEAFHLRTEPPIKRWALLPPQTHNEFLQVAVELGLPALGLFLLFWGLFAAGVWRCLRELRGGAHFYLLLGIGAGLAGNLFNSLLTFPFQTVTSGTFAWCVTGLAVAVCGGKFRTCELRLPVGRRSARLAFGAALALLVGFGLWYSWNIVRGQQLFFEALKTHAARLDYSLHRNEEAAALLPGRYEISFVQGWLSELASDTASARRWYSRSLDANPNFPETYQQLVPILYRNGDIAAAGELIGRYYRVYAGVPENDFLLVEGMVGIRSGTDEGLRLGARRIRQVGGLDPLMALAQAFQERGMTDSCLAVLDSVKATRTFFAFSPDLESQVRFFEARVALAARDTARARESLSWVIARGGEQSVFIVEQSRKMLGELDDGK